jgi:hypothetical protein
MDFHLEHGLRLNTKPEHKNLYKWAINEIDAKGKQVGRDQIPWEWDLNFTATSCVLCDSINIEQADTEETTPPANRFSAVGRPPPGTPPKVALRQVIRAQLRPGSRDCSTTFSMFGTNRVIKSFQLQIHPITDPAELESCSACGSVSYTAEVDFRNETRDDCIVFYIFVAPETFARYVAKVAHGLVDEISLRVGSVAGFYSEWSPSISTNAVKVLTTGSEQNIALPPGSQFEAPQLGHVGEAELFINRRLEFRKRDAPEPDAVEEAMDEFGTELAAPTTQAPATDPQMLQMLGSLFSRDCF